MVHSLPRSWRRLVSVFCALATVFILGWPLDAERLPSGCARHRPRFASRRNRTAPSAAPSAGPGSQAAIEGRTVEAINVDTGERQRETTSSTGGFTFKLKPGKYRVELTLR